MRAVLALKLILLAVVVLVGLVFLVGALLPAEHVATVSVLVPEPLDTVWTRVTTPTDYREWRKGLERVDVAPGAPLRWTEVSRFGEVPFVVEEMQPRARFVTRIADEKLPFGGTWTWELAEEGGGTRVTLTERGVVRPPLFRFLSRFVFGHDATMKQVLDGLVQRR